MTIADAGTMLTTGTLAAAEANAATFAAFLTPANIVASGVAAGVSLSTLRAAVDAMGGQSGLTASGPDFVRRATIAANIVLGTG